MKEGLPKEFGKAGISVSTANPERVYAVLEAEGDKGGVYRSDDAEHWERLVWISYGEVGWAADCFDGVEYYDIGAGFESRKEAIDALIDEYGFERQDGRLQDFMGCVARVYRARSYDNWLSWEPTGEDR